MKQDPFVASALGMTAIAIGAEIMICEIFLPKYIEVAGFLSLGVVGIGMGLLNFVPAQILGVNVNAEVLAPIHEELAVISEDVEAIRDAVAPRKERTLAYDIDELVRNLNRPVEQEESESSTC